MYNMGNTVICNTQYDVATMKWGNGSRMPTLAEAKELVDLCNWKWIHYNRVGGLLITGPNGNSIFFPEAGQIRGTYNNGGGMYWIGQSVSSETAYAITFASHSFSCWQGVKWYGCTVRPVKD